MAEQWRPVAGYEGFYEVSDLGRVRSLPRVITRKNDSPLPVPGRIMSPSPNGRAKHRALLLSRQGKVKTAKVHILVLEAFVGPRPEGQVARHLNDDPDDNRLANLAWGTQEENMGPDVRRNKGHYLTRRAQQNAGSYTTDS